MTQLGKIVSGYRAMSLRQLDGKVKILVQMKQHHSGKSPAVSAFESPVGGQFCS